MYCPPGGRQASEERSFCSGCGLPLEDSAALVAAGGRLAASDEAYARPLTARQRGTRKGVIITVGGILLFGLFAFLMTIKEDLFALLPLAALVIAFGVMRTLYGALLEEDR